MSKHEFEPCTMEHPDPPDKWKGPHCSRTTCDLPPEAEVHQPMKISGEAGKELAGGSSESERQLTGYRHNPGFRDPICMNCGEYRGNHSEGGICPSREMVDAGEIPDLATDDPHRREIEPHPIADFDVLVTNSDDEARAAILEVAENHLWDSNEPGQERIMKVRMNDVPAEVRVAKPTSESSGEADLVASLLLCPFCRSPGHLRGRLVDARRKNGLTNHYVVCLGQFSTATCGMRVSTKMYETHEEATAAWNTRAQPEWRPIESAPKDAEWASGGHQHGPLIIAYPVGHRVDTVYWWQTTDGKTCNFLDGGGNAAHPTHWMPLPAPPVAGQSNTEEENHG